MTPAARRIRAALGPKYTITVDGLAPSDDPAWEAAPPRVKAAFWSRAKESVLAAKRAEIAAGIDKDGRKFVPISERTRRHRKSWRIWADPDAPPLIPAHDESRTPFLLRVRQAGERVTLYWLANPDTGVTWGKILDMHRRGKGSHGPVPVRDTFGLSPKARAMVADDLERFWAKGASASFGGRIVEVDHPAARPPRGMPTRPASARSKLQFVPRESVYNRTYLTPEPAAGGPRRVFGQFR
jgi:hypothetical protein